MGIGFVCDVGGGCLEWNCGHAESFCFIWCVIELELNLDMDVTEGEDNKLVTCLDVLLWVNWILGKIREKERVWPRGWVHDGKIVNTH